MKLNQKKETVNRLMIHTVWPFVLTSFVLLVAMILSLNWMSAVRAYVGGESLWSKGQKEAVIALTSYVHTRSEREYKKYQRAIQIPLGDRKARVALQKSVPDLEGAYRGFVEGGNHSTDIPGMIRLFRYFGNTFLMKDPIRIWTRADKHIEAVAELARGIHQEVRTGTYTDKDMRRFVRLLNKQNETITPIEQAFSDSVAKRSTEATNFISTSLVSITIILMTLGIAFSRRLASQQISSSHALEKRAEKNLAFLRNASDGIQILDPEGNLIEASNMFCEMLGYRREELIGLNVSHWNAQLTPKEIKEIIRQVIDTNSTRKLETKHRRKNGEILEVEISGGPIEFDNQVYLYAATRDITDRKKSEAALRESQKRISRIQHMDAIGKLTSGIAHDFNNMVGVILGYSEILKNRLKDSAEDSEYVTHIFEAGKRSRLLTQKLQTFSRQNDLQEEITDINELIGENEFLVDKSLTAMIDVHYSLTNDAWPVMIDRSEFSNSFLNIMINAMHAMPDGGLISVATANISLDAGKARKMDIEPGEYLKIEFKDSGAGIPKELQDRILEPFFTTKGERGSGLGLSQVYGFIRQSRGGIDIESAEGRGTTIALFLPRLVGNRQQEDGSNQNKPYSSSLNGHASILVVDDEDSITTLTKQILTDNGYSVETASNGEAALSILQNKHVDLLLTDVIMSGMNGYELSNIARKKCPDIKVLLMSGFSDVTVSAIEDSSIIHNLIEKPFYGDALLERVKSVL